jgi:hypothetical protein
MMRTSPKKASLDMPGPLHAPTILVLYPFRFRDPLTHRWVKARYLTERRELGVRYSEWRIDGEPEYRSPSNGTFNPLRRET